VLRYIAQLDEGGYLAPVRIMLRETQSDRFVLTFDEFLRRTSFSSLMTRILKLLEKHYHAPVDTEFTVHIDDAATIKPQIQISILQCRPQSHLKEIEARLPENLNHDDIIFSTRRMAPMGRVSQIEYVLFVAPEAYFSIPNLRRGQNWDVRLVASIPSCREKLSSPLAGSVGHCQPRPGRRCGLR